ncbi:MAG: type I restriction endonuclease subunit R [Parcubacteria group bacterium]|nr:type I restriction endonuclease subunit R [Parcubacteria group bacterium]
MINKLNENSLVEQPVIDWLKALGYDYEFGPDLAPGQVTAERENFRDTLLVPRLKRSLMRLNPFLNEPSAAKIIEELIHTEHPNSEEENRQIFRLLTEGAKFQLFDKNDEEQWIKVRFFDFVTPQNNEFLVVNQLAVQGADSVRRPDVVVYVNGIPLAIFELKSPTNESGTIRSAHLQLEAYKNEIPELFKYNQFLVISDLVQARYGTIGSAWDRFAVWKGIESENDNIKGMSELEVLIKGIFQKERLMDLFRYFTVYGADSDGESAKYTKMVAQYHQYYGVNKAVEATRKAVKPGGDGKVGVFWHTQGSGKSLSMVFYVNKVKVLPGLKSPTFVFLTDRNDLDGQLHKTFARTGYPTAWQAPSVPALRERLKTPSGVVFTTIQKFEDEEDELAGGLSQAENIIVVADEAHRSQYATFAGNVRKALPNASFMGITGTPISTESRDTELVFGKYISTYKINQAVLDGATVPIFYEGRLVPLHLSNDFIDEEFETIADEYAVPESEVLKRKFAKLAELVGTPERMKQIAADIVSHFNNRGLEGKAMIVTMTRKIAADMYAAIRAVPNAPEVAVVVSKPENFEGKIQSETDAKQIERRFKNQNDPLKLVIVCDMWLTGFDVPHLHTMYIDKPLKNHTLMQAIARVNRIFRDKPAGLVVDYIGIADNLKKALSIYSADDRRDTMYPIEDIVAKMKEKYDVVSSMLADVSFAGYRKLSAGEAAKVFYAAMDSLLTDPKTGGPDEERKMRFLRETEALSKLFGFAMPHAEANKIRDDVEFFRALKRAVNKFSETGTALPATDSRIETAIRELIAESVAAEGVIDILKMQNGGKPDISIFDEKFLEEVKNLKYKNLAIEVLKKLLNDQLRLRMKKNVTRYETLMRLLEQIIEEYENNIINSSKVIERLVELAREIKKTELALRDTGLTEEEAAFYDLMSQGKHSIAQNGEFKAFVKELVSVVKRDLAVDWSNSEVIKSRIRANVRLMLLRKEVPVEEAEVLVDSIYHQAFALFRDYVPTS